MPAFIKTPAVPAGIRSLARSSRSVIRLGWLLLAANGLSASPLDELWNDPAVEHRIQAGITANRMEEAEIRLVDQDGKPVSHLTVQVQQTRHQFLFGANIFMLGQFADASENRRYEQAYLSLFNYATVPFYWRDLEPHDGQLRFGKDSPPLYRRPPPDAVVEFCQRNNLQMKGHPLVWHQWYPQWRPDDPARAMKRVERRITEIAARYGSSIPRWEVVNEPLERHQTADAWFNLPEDYLLRSFRFAQGVFPASSALMINEATNGSWIDFAGSNSPYFRELSGLIDHGVRIDAIGMQLHVFSKEKWDATVNGRLFTPQSLFRVLDEYAAFKRPIHITELTIPTLPDTPAGEQTQAKIVRNFYRLWFSHPSIAAISWWNLVDETAAKGEDNWRGGLLHRNFAPKPSYAALDQLLNREWKTALHFDAGYQGDLSFRGFLGEYLVTVSDGNTTVSKTFQLQKGQKNLWTVSFETPPPDPDLQWHDVTTWGLEGRAWPAAFRERWFDRLPSAIQKKVPEAVWNISRESSGMVVRFKTDAAAIWVDYCLLKDRLALPNSTAAGASGIDLYAQDGRGQWRWAGVAIPEGKVVRQPLASGLAPGLREYLAYLPLRNGIENLSIGVPLGSHFEPLGPRPEKPIVFYGTSITNGLSASRPGMVHTAILGRRLDRPVVNLGFAGSGRMDPAIGEWMAQIDAAVYVIDCLPNMDAELVRSRCIPFVTALHAARPQTPIVLVEDRRLANAWILPAKNRLHTENHAALRECLAKLKQAGITSLYYLGGDHLLGDDAEGTTDGSHPNDLGFVRQADLFEPVLRLALNRR